jgi:hypothetical protein
MPSTRPKLALLLVILAATATASAASDWARPTVTVGAVVPQAQRVPVERINHSTWTALLTKYVDDQGMVDYAAWKASAADQKALDEYLVHLSAASFGDAASREAQLAFGINAYNAVTVKGILREYPTSSIRNHTSKFGGYNIWKDLHLPIADRSYSLDQIEHEVLRKMREPRIHFAIVCAAKGCPRLRKEAYTAKDLESQLTDDAKTFFADRSKFTYDPARRTIAVSSILKWFGEDFGASQAQQMRAIAPYLPDTDARRLAEGGQARVTYLDYDWGINDQTKAGRR